MEIRHHSDDTKSRVHSVNMAYCVVDLIQGTEVVFSGSPIKTTLFFFLSLSFHTFGWKSLEQFRLKLWSFLYCLLKDRQLHKLFGILLCRFVSSSSFTDLFNNLLMSIWTQGCLFIFSILWVLIQSYFIAHIFPVLAIWLPFSWLLCSFDNSSHCRFAFVSF